MHGTASAPYIKFLQINPDVKIGGFYSFKSFFSADAEEKLFELFKIPLEVLRDFYFLHIRIFKCGFLPYITEEVSDRKEV